MAKPRKKKINLSRDSFEMIPKRPKGLRSDTKVSKVREAMRVGDWDTALKIASHFKILGKNADAIKRAAAANGNPQFYQQLGFNLDQVRSKGIAALKDQFSKSWDAVKHEIPVITPEVKKP